MISAIRYLVIGFLFFSEANAQPKEKPVFMEFHLQFGGKPLDLNKNYGTRNHDTLQINTLRFYISGIQLHYNDATVFNQPNSFHLLDAEKKASLRIPIITDKDKTISKVIFNIGIDSTTSSSGALTGDLDPIHGMYWAWQSGYINMKIEGTSPSCNTRKSQFQFHIGGYRQPYYAMRRVELLVKNDQLDIGMDVVDFFDSIALSKTNSIMIPGDNAMQLADQSVKMFKML